MLLIDGHNLIGKLAHITLGEPEDEAKLMRLLVNYHAVHPHDPILVVFDPAPNGRGGWSDPAAQNNRVRAFFARSGEKADDVIASVVQKAKSAASIHVVTSDNAVQRAVRRHGAKTITAEAFAATLEEAFRPPRQKAEPLRPPEEREKPQENDVTYWLSFFKEPPPEPPAPAAPARRARQGNAPPQPSSDPGADKPARAGDVDEWLRLFGQPRSARDEKHLPPPETPPPPAVRRGVAQPEEVDSVEYWLREMSKKRPRDE